MYVVDISLAFFGLVHFGIVLVVNIKMKLGLNKLLPKVRLTETIVDARVQ